MSDSAPEIYSALVGALLDSETGRRTSLEAKASGIVTTAGTLVTLLFGLVAVITGQDGFRLPTKAHGWLGAAIVLFILACVCAILVSIPLPYSETQVTEDDLVTWWDQDGALALLAVSSARLKALRAARRMNGIKAAVLIAATLLLLAALVMLGIAVGKILRGA